MKTVLSAIIVIDAEAVSTDKFQTPCPGSAAGKLFKTRHNNNLLSANNALYNTKNTPKTQRHGKIGVSQFFFSPWVYSFCLNLLKNISPSSHETVSPV